MSASLAGAGTCLLISSRRTLGWGGLMLEVVVFGVVYLLALVITRFFDKFDLNQAARLLPVLGPAVRRVSGE